MQFLKAKNPHFKVFWANVERFGLLYQKLQALLPQGDARVPVRVTRNRVTTDALEQVIGDTLQDEDAVLVVLDPGEFPKSWAVVNSLADVVGSASYRVESATGNEAQPIDADLRKGVQETASKLSQQAYVKLNDPHLDAKVFPHLHPWGSGSLYSQDGSGGLLHMARSRLLSIESGFRKDPVWSFWMLDRVIKNDLYFRQLKRCGTLDNADKQDANKTTTQTNPDPLKARGHKRKIDEVEGEGSQDVYGKLFGRVDDRSIPESAAWWRSRQAELMAISAAHEKGSFTGMVTLTQNDASAELLANARRGPCAEPTDDELVEYLLTHQRSHQPKRPNITTDATAAVLSYQRHVHALKNNFLRQNTRTPLAHVTDYWDRTEAQMRHSLHGHIPFWAKRRKLEHTPIRPRVQTLTRDQRNAGFTMPWSESPAEALDGAVPPDSTVPLGKGVATPSSNDAAKPQGSAVLPGDKVPPSKFGAVPLKDGAVSSQPPFSEEDYVYQDQEVARVIAKLVRPAVHDNDPWTRQHLLWAFLARAIQTHGYIHACTLRYCLHNRSSCRFFFPWPETATQQFDETLERIEFERPHAADDRWVVPHNLEIAMMEPAVVNVVLFDPEYGAEQSRLYAAKYCSKPEPWYYLECADAAGAANPVKRFLKSRNVGLCMAHNRLMNFHVVRSTVPTQYIHPQFTVDAQARAERSPEHKEKAAYPDPDYYLWFHQKYWSRNKKIFGRRWQLA